MIAAMLSGTGLKILAAAAVAALVAGAVWHYVSLRAERDEFMLKASQEQQAHEQTQASFKAFAREAARVEDQRTKSMSRIQAARKTAVAESAALKKLLTTHDLGVLAAKKPAMIQTKVNEATRKMFADIEALTQ